MLTPALFVLVAISSTSSEIYRGKRGRWKNDYSDKFFWKKEYEDELTDALLIKRKKDNVTTRVVQSTDNESVIEKLIETITSSEKYLKKMDSINLRLNRLNTEVHDKTNSILAQLTDTMEAFRSVAFADKFETIMETINTQVNEIKYLVKKAPRPITVQANTADGAAFHADSKLDTRLELLENNVRTVVAGVDSILVTIAEVKNRQHATRTLSKMDSGSSIDALNLMYEFRRSLNKCDSRNGRYDRAERYPTDCHEIQLEGFNVSGIYKIKPEDVEAFYVLCDLTTTGGGWTVFQSRFDGSQEFYKGWSDYKHGFGNLAGEFWLGLEKLSCLTNRKMYELRVELETQRGHEATAGYSVFTVGLEHEGYRISTLGAYFGTAGDSLTYHAGQKFSTFDMDNDEWKDGACASEHGGAWWYKECDKSNLNGKYSAAEEDRDKSMYWISFKGRDSPLAKTRMMIRPLPATKPVDFTQPNRNIESHMRGRHDQRAMRSRHGEQTRARKPYRYEEPAHADDFLTNHA